MVFLLDPLCGAAKFGQWPATARVGVAGRLNVMRREGTIDFVRRSNPC